MSERMPPTEVSMADTLRHIADDHPCCAGSLLDAADRIEELEKALSQETPPAVGRIHPTHLLAWGEQIRKSQRYESTLSAWLTRLGTEWAALAAEKKP